MSEQTANLCTTDACESLRARLAKYEDAEGRPVSTIAEQALEIERLSAELENTLVSWGHVRLELAALKAQPDPWQASGADWCSSIHSNPDAKAWADFFVAVFPGQADKHELMIGWFANAMMAMHDHLKAQPSGVVLPERLDIPHRDEFESADQYAAAVGEAKKWNACLDEVARLNSSPVSAGDDRKLSDIGNELHNLSCHVVHHNESWANQLGTLASELWNWQARAALTASAPHHSEQVRESGPDYKRKFECLVEHAKRQDRVIYELRYNENIRRFYDDGAVWFWAGDETDNLETLACPVVINAGDLRALLAAAPSAGSQGGDV